MNIHSFSGSQIRINGGQALVAGNYLGTTHTGNAAASGNGPVILLITSAGNTIGGTGANDRNVIGGGLQQGATQGRGIDIITGGGNLIMGNHIGVGADGSTAIPNQQGILISDSDGNTVGGSTAAARNVISGNQGNGLLIQSISGDSRGNQVLGNYIGTNAAGTAALPNGSQGLRMTGNSKTSIAGPGNLISGNTSNGLYLESDSVFARGNVIGLNAAQSAALGNSIGIYAGPFAGIQIGGSGAGEGNVVAGNRSHGMHVVGAGAGRLVQGNRVGLSASDQLFGNGASASGILLQGASGVTVGGTASGAGNIIGGHGGAGINVNTSTGILIQGNTIGLNSAQTSARPNANGILVEGSGSNASIGGTAAGAGNVISGNSNHGIFFSGQGAGSLVQGNLVGTTASSSSGLGNGGDGIRMENAPSVTIGGIGSGARNVVSGNGQSGITATGTSSKGIVVKGNYVGTNISGSSALPNASNGIFITNGATRAIVGDTLPGGGNLISGNAASGVLIEADSATVLGNIIGLDASGAAAIPNLHGVYIIFAKNNLVGGTNAAARNVISGNSSYGVWLRQSSSTGNRILGNYIGTNISGTTDLGNASDGIRLTVGASGNFIGGTAPGAGNLISGNNGHGLYINAQGNTVQGNVIGLNASGTAALGNSSHGIFVENVPGTVLGGATAAARNVVSGNGEDGINIAGTAARFSLVQGNYLGTNAAGTAGLGNVRYGLYVRSGAKQSTLEANLVSGNGSYGIYVLADSTEVYGNVVGLNAAQAAAIPNVMGIYVGISSDVMIGGEGSGEGNVVAGNSSFGIYVFGTGTANRVIRGNRIGLNASDVIFVNGNSHGLFIDQADNVMVGGANASAANIIGGHAQAGIRVKQSSQVLLRGNIVGLNASQTAKRQNGWGIFVGDNSAQVAIGDTVAGNIVAGNGGTGIYVQNSGAGISIAGNYVGTTASGATGLGNSTHGIIVENTSGVVIGGTTAGARNIVSGNANRGIWVKEGCSGTTVAGNVVGLGADGSTALGNGESGAVISAEATAIIGNIVSANAAAGISLSATANGSVVKGNIVGLAADGSTARGNNQSALVVLCSTGCTIGGTMPDDRNVFSGSLSGHGINLQGSGSVIQGNYIGTDVTGTLARGAGGNGIYINNSSSGHTIGGTTAAARNLISGNRDDGIHISDTSSTSNTVQGNYIGTNAAGTAALGNGRHGVYFYEAGNDNRIGTSGAGNLISGNLSSGIRIVTNDFANQNTRIQGNYIGTNAAGDAAIPNETGIQTYSGKNSLIGGSGPGEGNLISGNSRHGIHIFYGNMRILGNVIGLNAAGTAALPNAENGIYLYYNSSGNMIIGDSLTGGRNVISGNGANGIRISGPEAANSWVIGNYIGTDPSGSLDLGNAQHGVLVDGNATQIRIGGTTAAARNVIGGNTNYGVCLATSSGCMVKGNYIGVAPDGSTAVANGWAGIYAGGSNHLIGGTAAGAGNLLSGNGLIGVHVSGSGIAIEGNRIGTNAAGTAAVPNISEGVRIDSANNRVGGTTAGQGNLISGNMRGIWLNTAATGNVIEGNWIGTAADQTTALPNTIGIFIQGSTNTIGGTTSAARNLISGNTQDGIQISDTSSTSNTVQGNYIGTNVDGTAALGNGRHGVYLLSGASNNSIGGAAAGAGNVISGNGASGIQAEADSNVIQGNLIGTIADGTAALGNGTTSSSATSGISLNGADYNTIGGTTPSARNVISGNVNQGVRVSNSTFNTLQGNYIGTNASGTAAIPNGTGVALSGKRNTVGGNVPGAGNVISGNHNDGISINADSNTVAGNYIGLTAAGNDTLPNQQGIYVINSGYHFIGGTAVAARNVISGNRSGGIKITNPPATNIRIWGNYIGTDATGTVALGNPSEESFGIYFNNGATANYVGGDAAGAGNLISGNGGNGIHINSNGQIVMGNTIGLNAAGTAVLPNQKAGIHISNKANNQIGGTTSAARNLISGNTQDGIQITGTSSTSNLVQGNYIGTNVDGTAALANGRYGVYLTNSATGNTIGGTSAGAGNLISGNPTAGIAAGGANTIRGNTIGRNASNSANLPNGYGIFLNNAANTQVGGTATGAGNVIAGNNKDGVALISAAAGISMLQNSIFGNGEIGIDLGDNSSNGVTPNDGARTSGQPNSLMDFPVLSAALLSGNTLFVQGYIGTAPGDSDFAGARIEIFRSDNDPSSHGEGQTYLGFLTADAQGNFSGNLSVSGINPGDGLTATATDTNGNTSEFGLSRILVKRAYVNPHLPIWTSEN